MTLRDDGLYISLVFVIASCLLTVHSIRQHLHWNTVPRLRKHIVRILCLVPLYAVTSWLGLAFSQWAIVFVLLRECYEALVIYSFYSLLVQYCGGEDRLSYRLASKEDQKHLIPFCCLPTWRMVDYEGLNDDEKRRVHLIVQQRERELLQAQAASEPQAQAAAALPTRIDEGVVASADSLSILELKDDEHDEFILQHPPNSVTSSIESLDISHDTSSQTPLPHSNSKNNNVVNTIISNAITSRTNNSSTSDNRTRRNAFSRFIPSFSTQSRSDSPKQATHYMARGSLAHAHVASPFTPHTRSFSRLPSTLSLSVSEGSSRVASAPPSSSTSPSLSPSSSYISTSPSHARLPYLYSPFLFWTQVGTLQYCCLKPVLALIAFLLSLANVYGNGEFKLDEGYPYLASVTNASQIWAMYCLILFYLALKDDLRPMRPVPKFLLVKAVVFMTWWQSVLFAVLEFEGVIKSDEDYSAVQLTTSLQDFVISIEMFFAALGHLYFFSWKDFFDENNPCIIAPIFTSIAEIVNVSDVYVQDTLEMHKRHKSREKRKAKNRQTVHSSSLDQVLLSTTIEDEKLPSMMLGTQLRQPSIDTSPLVENGGVLS